MAWYEEGCGKVCGAMFGMSVSEGRPREGKWTIIVVGSSKLEVGPYYYGFCLWIVEDAE